MALKAAWFFAGGSLSQIGEFSLKIKNGAEIPPTALQAWISSERPCLAVGGRGFLYCAVRVLPARGESARVACVLFGRARKRDTFQGRAAACRWKWRGLRAAVRFGFTLHKMPLIPISRTCFFLKMCVTQRSAKKSALT